LVSCRSVCEFSSPDVGGYARSGFPDKNASASLTLWVSFQSGARCISPALEFSESRCTQISTQSASRVPVRWRQEVERVLITEDQIARRIGKMSREIMRDFAGRELVVVSLLNGTVLFLADLIRNLSFPCVWTLLVSPVTELELSPGNWS
jgi:hypothetical protein